MPSSAAFERRERAAVGQRSGPIARAGQAGGARERQRPGRDRECQVPRRVERPGIRVLQRDAIARGGREDQWLTGNQANGLRGRLQVARRRAETSEVLPWGSVAVAVTMGRSGRRREGDVEDGLAPAVGRHLQRPEVVLGLARAAGTVAGAGEELDAEGRVGHAAAQPALEPAVGGRDDDREVLEVVRALAGRLEL